MKRRKKIVKGIISYILALALTIFFALYMNATVGWFMLVALILALVLSVFFALLTSVFVKAECEMEDCILAKGDTCQMTVTIQNKSLFPTTPLEVEILNGEGVKSENNYILISLLPFERQAFQVTFQAKICGPSVVGVKSVKATDYLGLLAFKIHKSSYENLKRNVAVIPNMADVSVRDDKILKVMQASLHAEEGDDTVEVSSNTFGGFPGCDNREYVPGDPLKRVNWKQSAKRGKLLVRLDDVLASKSVNLVLDSVFWRKQIDTDKIAADPAYTDLPKEDIPAKIAEDAVETALGIARALILSSYSVNFFVAKEAEFERYELEDEKDIENMRLLLAGYAFDSNGQKDRFPKEDILDRYTAFLFCTPNDYKEVFGALKEGEDASRMSVFSITGDIREKKDEKVILRKEEAKASSSKEKLKSIIGSMIIPYLLSLVSSVTLFAVFGVSPLSFWTLLQAVFCAGIFALCQYAKGHKLIGGAMVSVVIVVSLFFFSRVAFSGVEYLQWFMSGADSIENTFSYLMSLILVFTMLFSMVLFYYTQVYYRTSAILLVTIIPYVVYVKLIREVGIGYVMLAIVLNVAAFLINTRKQRDRGKRIVGYKKGIVSVILYAVCFVLIAFAVPKDEETKYYHFFEEWFLGGNTSVPIPEEYGDKNEHSGNADNFNQLTNRQLYNVYNADLSEALYLRRQVFDYYDFENHRWYDDDEYSEYSEQMVVSGESRKYLNNTIFLELLQKADEASPGFLEKYNLEHLKEVTFEEKVSTATIMSRNFESYYLITPTKTQEVSSYYDDKIYMTEHGIYGNETESFVRNASYKVKYISEFQAKSDWLSLGGSNMDYDTSGTMIAEMYDIISDNYDVESPEYEAALAIYAEDSFAREYANACKENTAKISDKVRNLALEITKDCTYEWEKAEALERYFLVEGFTYDLEYDAPDDSVEYFLFEGKTGTCSDFASAYVLLARAAGLTVRYVEGFVPAREVTATYEWQYVVRTKTSHAYPEVYIPNLGFVVYEPTVGVVGESERMQNTGVVSYITILAIRVFAILAGVAFVIALILIISRIIAPAISEKRFLKKVAKAENGTAIILLYKRILEKHSAQYIKEAAINTPYEYAELFECIFGADISSLIYLVEKSAYRNMSVTIQDKKAATEMYMQAKKVVKEHKRKSKSSRFV